MVPAIKVFEVISDISSKDNLNLTDYQKHIIMVMAQVNYYHETYSPLFVNRIKGDGTYFFVQDMDKTSVLPALRMSHDNWVHVAIPAIKKSIEDYLSFSNDELDDFFNIGSDEIINGVIKNHGFLTLSDISAIERNHNPIYKA